MKENSYRSRIVQILIGVAALTLLLNAAQLQIFDVEMKSKAKRATLRKKTVYPSRGIIFDRNDKLMVVNESSYELEAIYRELDPSMDTLKFCELLDIDKSTFKRNIEKDWSSRKYRKSIAFTFLKRISPANYSQFQEHLHEFPGFYPVQRNIRTYPHKNAAHVLGYLGEVDRNMINNSSGKYAMGDYVGVYGMEKSYDMELRGKKGKEYVIHDNLGREVRNLSDTQLDSSAVSGLDMNSSIDLDLQSYGELLMSNKRGSIVALEPSTGEILCMLSAPAYDPNIMSIHKDRGDAYERLTQDTLNRPIIDRSLRASYPPGSIFKPVLSLIALQEGVTHAGRRMKCDGEYETNTKGQSQGCHDHPTPRNIAAAIQYSCNSYFYQLCKEFIEKESYYRPGEGLDQLADYLDQFGIGRKLGVDNLYEEEGFMPRSNFYDKLYKNEVNGWKSSYMLSLGIGQGELQLTTVQMANLAAIIANRGYYYVPHLIKGFKNSDIVIPEKYSTRNYVEIDQQHFEPVIDGMEKVIKAGTAMNARVPGIAVCGKTGTSQNGKFKKDHSVFFAFAPKDDPKIAIAVYVENAGWGTTTAAPIASLMMEKYLNGEIAPNRKPMETAMVEHDLITIP